MKKYRITGKSYYKDALKHRVKETDSEEEAEEIYERFCRKYFDVKIASAEEMIKTTAEK